MAGAAGVLGRIEEGEEAAHHQLDLVAGAIALLALGSRDLAGRHDQHPIALGVELLALAQQGAAIGIGQLPHLLAIGDLAGDGQHLFHRPLGDHQLLAQIVLHDHRQAPAHEVERQLVHLAVVGRLAALPQRIGVLDHRDIHQVLHAALVKAVEPGQLQDPVVPLATHVVVVLEDDLVLGQGAGLVGAEHVHGTEVLHRVEPLHHHLALGHGYRAARQVGGDDHRQHLGGEPHRHRQREGERRHPVTAADPAQHEDDGHHHQHEADQQLGNAVHAAIETGLDALVAHHVAGQRTEVGVAAGGHHHGAGGTAHHVGAHEADVGQIEQSRLPCAGAVRRLAGHGAQGVVLLHRQRFAGQHRLADEEIAGFDQLDVGRDHVPRLQVHYVTGHQLGHRHLLALGGNPGRGATLHGGGIAHQRLERLGRLGRAILLPETQQTAQAHHDAEDDHLDPILVARLGHQHVHHVTDQPEHDQHHHEGVLERLQQLDQRMGRLVVGHLVGTKLDQTVGGLGRGEAVDVAAHGGEGVLEGLVGLIEHPGGELLLGTGRGNEPLLLVPAGGMLLFHDSLS